MSTETSAQILVALARYLSRLLDEKGEQLMEQTGTCRNLLMDAFPKNAQAVQALMLALQERIPNELKMLARHAQDIDPIMKRLETRLEKNTHLKPPLTHWAVESWARALKLKPEEPQLKELNNSLGMHFILVSPGTFMMGSPLDDPQRAEHETQHQVTLTRPYYLQSTLVTQAQWLQVMETNPSAFQTSPEHPVDSVTWQEAVLFAQRLSEKTGELYRLPSEAEWEYAARAGTQTPYFFGDEPLNDYVWHAGNSKNSTQPVAQKKPNPWGFYDMNGNLWEWCQDWFAEFTAEAQTDPQGPESGTGHVFKGGSWFNNTLGYFRPANRYFVEPDYRDSNFGFRLVCELI